MAMPKNASFYIKVAIWLIIIAVVWNIPPAGALTVIGMHNLAAFVGLIFGMITLGFTIPCYGTLIIMAFSGAYDSMMATLSAGFGGDMFLMIFSILLVSGVIAYSGLARIIAIRVINSKIAAGRPWMLTFMIMAISALLSVFINPMVTIVIVSSICLEIMNNLGIEKGNKWALLILLDVAVVSIVSQDIMPFQSGPAIMSALMSGFDKRLTIYASLGTFMLVGLLWAAIIFVFMFFLTRLICINSIDKLKEYKPSDKAEPFTRDAITALVVFAVYVLIQLLPVFFPAGNSIRHFFEYLGLPGCGFLVALIAMMIYRKDGNPFIIMKQISDYGIDWNILSMLVAIGAISVPMTFESTGILTWLTNIVSPIAGGMGMYGIFVFLCLISLVLTNFSDNLAIVFVIVPLTFTIAMAANMNGLSMMVWNLHSIQLGIFLPCATPHIALIFSKEDTGYVSRIGIMKWASVTVLFAAIMIMTFGWMTYSWFPNVFQ